MRGDRPTRLGCHIGHREDAAPRRPPARVPTRAGDTTSRERAALTFLREIGSDAGPRILAHDDTHGLVIMEDLGRGDALEDLLAGDDPAAAAAGFVAFAQAVGRMHAATRGRQAAFYAHLQDHGASPPGGGSGLVGGSLASSPGGGSGLVGGSLAFPRRGVDPRRDLVSLANVPLAERWSALCDLATRRDGLPDTTAAGRDIDDVLEWMSAPGPMLVLFNGDLAVAGHLRSQGRRSQTRKGPSVTKPAAKAWARSSPCS